MVKVVNKFIDELREQVKDKGVRIRINDTAINLLIEKGFDSKMGARPLQRTIDQMIKRPLSKMMLFGDLKDGGNLAITVEDGEIKLIKKIKASKVPQVENEAQTEDSNKENQEII
jgi:ATP-dependent Clp protease ATP-binding subunit ClpA